MTCVGLFVYRPLAAYLTHCLGTYGNAVQQDVRVVAGCKQV